MNEEIQRMMDHAQELTRLEAAAYALQAKAVSRWDWRAALAAGLGALLSLIPSVSAAQSIIL